MSNNDWYNGDRVIERLQAGLSFDEILAIIIPEGFFLPVSPGTRYVTVGGAIAADVHGKNHHKDGTFGKNVKRLLLIDGNRKSSIELIHHFLIHLIQSSLTFL